MAIFHSGFGLANSLNTKCFLIGNLGQGQTNNVVFTAVAKKKIPAGLNSPRSFLAEVYFPPHQKSTTITKTKKMSDSRA